MDALISNISSSIDDKPNLRMSPEIGFCPSIGEIVSSIKKQPGLFTARSNDDDDIAVDDMRNSASCAIQINNDLEWNKGTFDNRDRKVSSISSSCIKDFSLHLRKEQPQISGENMFESPKGQYFGNSIDGQDYNHKIDLAPDYVISQTPELNGEDSRVSAAGAIELRILLDRVNSSVEKLEFNNDNILISNDHG